MPPRKYYPSTPFAKWLVRYACSKQDHPGRRWPRKQACPRTTLYNYIQNSRQKPDLKVILRLSEYTGEPAEKLARLAGIAGYKPREPRIQTFRELMNIYNRLPVSMKKYMLTNARQLAASVQVMKAHSSENPKKR